jgi:hypothetical protein
MVKRGQQKKEKCHVVTWGKCKEEDVGVMKDKEQKLEKIEVSHLVNEVWGLVPSRQGQ